MRDSERQKTYAAENRWETFGVVGLDEAADITDLLCQDFEIRSVAIIHKPEMTQYVGTYNSFPPRIHFKSETPSLKTVLHEFAHHLARSRHSFVGRSHGGRFIEAMLDTVQVHFGDATVTRALKREFLKVGLTIRAEDEDAREDTLAARKVQQRQRVGERGQIYIVSYRMNDDRVFFLGRGQYLERDQETVKVYRREWSAHRAAGRIALGRAEVHELNGVFEIPEWDGYGYPSETPRWMPVNDVICDQIAAARERQIIAESK